MRRNELRRNKYSLHSVIYIDTFETLTGMTWCKHRHLSKDTFVVRILSETGVESVADVLQNGGLGHGRLDADDCGYRICSQHFVTEHKPGVRWSPKIDRDDYVSRQESIRFHSKGLKCS